jgi:selenide,water dikinase
MIVGGHTVDDAEPKYGLAVVGTVKPGLQVSNSGAMPGDSLVLTKPLGTGIITTGAKQGTAPADILQAAVDSMSALNLSASEAMIAVGVNACTDISGYGLMGHLKGMVRGSNVGANIRSSRVPLLPGTKELLGQGAVPGGTQRNLQGVADSVNWQSDVTEDDQLLLCDAQTSGGLLISVPSQKTDELVSHLEAAGVAVAAVIGEITEGPKGKIQVSS